jgi:4-aminobutyrate aminotransferase-like enzyme
MFAIEHYGVEPDLVVMAKSLAGGFPLAAVVGKAQLMDAPPTGGLGGTYAGSRQMTGARPGRTRVLQPTCRPQ